ncbi:hypothetical protein ZOSMA_82G00220 [Zostera marina]|uniref:Uncharacterized protein n=1 Tax=Zostera marina TaxID=29655 RepID=A0A0K9NP14_ZOSMR|nr:hypothetical protein ZOSMA_82G00220 [Zostera marina]
MSGQLVITQIQHSCILQFTDLRRLRLAITITDAGEFPMFIGMHPVKSLSFRKMASRFFSKMDAGIGPMNLLKRRSKYLNVGSSRISVGNRPENSLLLASNSCENYLYKNLKI